MVQEKSVIMLLSSDSGLRAITGGMDFRLELLYDLEWCDGVLGAVDG